MAYIPDALDATQPDINVDASTAAAEFRALKAQLKLVGATVTTWNQNDKDESIELLGGNLISVKLSGALGAAVRATFPKSAGKYYWEITITLLTASMVVGVGQLASSINTAVGNDALSYGYRSDGSSVHAGAAVAMGAAYVTGDIIGIAHDFDLGIASFYKIVAGIATLQGTIATGWLTNTNIYPMHSITAIGDISVVNFGGGAFSVLAVPATYAAYSSTATAINSAAAINSAVSVALTASSAGYQYVTMIAQGQHIQLPSGITMPVGGPRFYLQNDGQYPFGVRDGAGTLLTSVMPGGAVFITWKTNVTVAGVVGITGNGQEAGLCLFDSGLLSNTYLATTVFSQSAALTADVCVFFLKLAAGFAAVAYDNVTKTLGVPITVTATANMVPVAAWRVDATHCIVFYNDSVVNHRVQVLTLSAVNTLTTGIEAIAGAPAWSTEDWFNAPKICQLTGTLYAAVMANGGGTVDTRSIEVTAGNTVTIGAAVSAGNVNVTADSGQIYPLDATHSLVLWSNGAGAPFTTSVRVGVHISTVTTFPGAAVAWSAAQTNANTYACCQLSATAFILNDDNNTTTVQRVTPLLIAGTVLTVGATLSVETGMGSTSALFSSLAASRWIPRLFPLTATTALLWYQDSTSLFSRFVVITDAANVLTAGQILFRSMVDSASASGFPLGFSATDFLVVKQYVAAPAYSQVVVPHKINGTVITYGSPLKPANAMVKDMTGAQMVSTRLSSGDYIFSDVNEAGGLAVARTGGDFVRDRGVISQPSFTLSARPVIQLSPVKVAFLGRARGVTIATPATNQLRLIVTEIATP